LMVSIHQHYLGSPLEHYRRIPGHWHLSGATIQTHITPPRYHASLFF
jgi:hypothetical protein